MHVRTATQVETIICFVHRPAAHRAHTNRPFPAAAHDAQDLIDQGGHATTLRREPHGEMKRS
jgi:hypothetical protein